MVLERCLIPRGACCWLSGPTSLIHLLCTFLSVGVSPQYLVSTEDAGLCDYRYALLEVVSGSEDDEHTGRVVSRVFSILTYQAGDFGCRQLWIVQGQKSWEPPPSPIPLAL